jgi:hypothetical protein
MATKVRTLLTSITIAACTSGTGPNGLNLTGTYDGSYTTTIQPRIAYQAEIRIVQNGDTVWGTLHTTSGRSANVHGPIIGWFLAMRVAFNDTCGGSIAFSLAAITDGGRHLTGSFNTSGGCDGQYNAAFSLTKQ